jgi:WD40 repeat protein
MRTPNAFCPYVGLQPYTEAERNYFFGRERDKRIIASNLFAAPLTILYGASGVGKSSVLMAGVVPELRNRPRTAVVLFREWQRADFVSALKAECASAVERAQQEPLALDSRLPLDEWLFEAARAFGGALLILFDQFEEYFLYHPETATGDAFESEFARTVNREEIEAGFLITLREDALSKLDLFRARIPNLLGNTLRLQHLDRAAAEEAIRKPLDVYNREHTSESPITIEDDLVQGVLAQVQAGKVSLAQSGSAVQAEARDGKARIETPFLQLVMTRVWDEELKTGSRVLRFETLQRLGGAERLVRTHLDQTMKRLPRQERAIAARLFHFLVTPTGTKIAYTAHDLASYAEKPQEKVQPVLERLSSPGMRILRCLAPESGHSARYEIFHDVLGAAVIDWHRRFADRQRLWRRIRRISYWPLGAFLAILALAVIGVIWFTEEEELKEHKIALQLQQDRAVPYYRAILRGSVDKLTSSAFSPDGRFVITAGDATTETIADRFFFTRTEVWDTNTWRRETVAFFGHSAWITSVAFSPDGRFFVTASADKTAQVRRTDSRDRVAELAGHGDVVWSASFSPDGQRVVTASSDKTARLWEAGSGRSIAELRGHADIVWSAVFSPDGTRIATASKDQTARLWDARTGQSLLELRGHSDQVLRSVFSPDGRWIVTAGLDRTARLWDADTGGLVRTLAQPGPVERVQFSTDGRLIVTTDGLSARVWEAHTGENIALLSGHTGWLADAQFSPDGRQVVTASFDNTARVWDLATRESVAELRGHFDDVTSAAFSPDGEWILTMSADSTARVWEVKPAKMLLELRGHTDVLRAAISGDGRRIATAGTDKTVRVWDADTGNTIAVLSGHPQPVHRVEFNPDGRSVLAASGNAVWIWQEGRKVAEFAGRGNAALGTFSADGKWVVTFSDGKTARLLNVASGQSVVELSYRDVLAGAEFSPGGETLVTVSGATAQIWEAATGKQLAELRGHQGVVTSALFSPDGSRIVTVGTDWTARVWDVATGRSIAVLPGHRNQVFSAAFSPDGKRVVTASKDKTARIWDAATGESQAELIGHWDSLVSADFSPDGKLVATASADGTGRIWDASTGQRIAELVGHQGALSSAAFTPDGERVITTSADGTARVWEAVPHPRLPQQK